MLTPEALDVLQIRQANAKTSVAKFAKMLEIADEDDRVRYILQFAGAGRTWRWGGRAVQPQNMARPSLSVRSIEIARDLVKDYDTDMLDLLFDDSMMEILSSIARSMFAAPEGKKLVVCDFSAVENVVLGYCADATSILSIFEEGLDPYKSFGVPLLGKKYDDITKAERTFCKPPVLGCGFMLGGPGLKRYADGMGVAMTEEEAERAKSLWRDTYHEVPAFWYALSDAFMNVIKDKKPREIGPIRLAYEKPMLRMYLPSGRALSYVKPRIEQKRKPWVDKNTGKPAVGPTIVYDGVHQNTKQWVALTTHPGKLTENCLAGDTEVLTPDGWLPIVELTTEPVWDGVAWVAHDGVVHQGEQEVIEVRGLRLTPDHQLLTEEGWTHASQSARSHWPEVSLPDGDRVRGVERERFNVGGSLRVRRRENGAGHGPPSKANQVLRVQARRADQSVEDNARDGNPPGLLRLAQHDRSLSSAFASGLGQLRRSWDHGLRSLAGIVREFLGRHGRLVPAGADVGAFGQRAGLLPGELRVANCETSSQQPAQFGTHRDAPRREDCRAGVRKVRAEQIDSALPAEGRSAVAGVGRARRRYEPVYDILNCGPRHRFAVRPAGGGPVTIAHNCVQAIARDLLAQGLKNADAMGFEIVGHVHDEIIALADIDGDLGLPQLEEAMLDVPTWATEIPLSAEGYESDFYRKD